MYFKNITFYSVNEYDYYSYEGFCMLVRIYIAIGQNILSYSLGCKKGVLRGFEQFWTWLSYARIGLKCSYFDGSLKYLWYWTLELHVHLLHHKSLPNMSLNSFNLIFNDKTKNREYYEGLKLPK